MSYLDRSFYFQKSPIISGSFAEIDLHLEASSASLPPWMWCLQCCRTKGRWDVFEWVMWHMISESCHGRVNVIREQARWMLYPYRHCVSCIARVLQYAISISLHSRKHSHVLTHSLTHAQSLSLFIQHRYPYVHSLTRLYLLTRSLARDLSLSTLSHPFSLTRIVSLSLPLSLSLSHTHTHAQQRGQHVPANGAGQILAHSWRAHEDCGTHFMCTYIMSCIFLHIRERILYIIYNPAHPVRNRDMMSICILSLIYIPAHIHIIYYIYVPAHPRKAHADCSTYSIYIYIYIYIPIYKHLLIIYKYIMKHIYIYYRRDLLNIFVMHDVYFCSYITSYIIFTPAHPPRAREDCGTYMCV